MGDKGTLASFLPAPHFTLPPAAAYNHYSMLVSIEDLFGLSGGATVRSHDLQSLDLGVRKPVWRTLAAATPKTSLTFSVTRTRSG